MECISELEFLDGFLLPRCSHFEGKGEESSTLHVFSDATPRQCGASAYLVTTYTDGSKNTKIPMSKGTVTTFNDITLAKAELLATMVAVQLVKCIADNFVGKIKDVKFWTGSK
ncbi:hypothetical protein HPB48_005575 [Haemaphysalis longicornis]|uniref:Uncharacterized protein n=1 Tax=Haemaphysalis longicornis TaxID=44386 RepID=A0A9J6GHB6_HAELO|nr:hypothetical protein HPB48_005575 [Haemaphysalis longicornis]